MRILIVAYAFPPMNSSGSKRPWGWARAWRDLGHDVHVLTATKYAFDGPMDLTWELPGVEVHEVPYLSARPAAPGDGARAPDRQRLDGWERLKTWTRRARFSLAMFGDPRQAAYRPLARAGLALMQRQPFDLIVATSPPEVAFFTARALSKQTGVPWVADFRDLWFHDMRLQQSRAASWLSGIVQRRVVRGAALLVTVSRGLRERLSAYLGRDVLVSYNGYLEEPRPAPARPAADGRIHIVYTGRVYPGRQDPEPLFRALDAAARAPGGLRSAVAVDFYGFEEPSVQALAAKYRLEDCVRIHGFVPHVESLAAQRAADALLFLDWTDTRAEGMLTGKLFEYLASGRPILALGPRADSEPARLIAEAGRGATFTQHEDIVAYLRRLSGSPRAPDADPAAVGAYSRERQARTLLSAIISRLP
jgi:glycosyltransferase involved in cell wall biosynthesis